MKYKLKMKKKDFYKISDELIAKNIEIKDEEVLFECESSVKDKLSKSRYEVEVLTSDKIEWSKRIKKSMKYVVALLFFAAVIYINSFRVSKINYNEELPINTDITEKLENKMTHLFFFNFLNINYEAFAKELREEYPMYPWINVEKKASTINVNIYKYDDNYQKNGTETPGHVVAKKDAVIDAYYIYKGINKVHTNQYVKKGDILVSGNIDNQNNENQVAAKAKIMGYTYEVIDIKVEKNKKENILSGNKEVYFALDLFDLRYNFNYDALYLENNSTEKTIFNFFDFISVKKIEEYEKYDIIKTYTKEEAIEYAKSVVTNSFIDNKTVDEERIVNLECLLVEETENEFKISLLSKKYESIAEFIKIS